jgi:hypothetical protein
VISFLEQKTVDKNEDPVKQKLSKVYREIIEKELNDICDEVIQLLDNNSTLVQAVLDLLEAWIPLLFGRLFHTHFAMTRHIHLVTPGMLPPLTRKQ